MGLPFSEENLKKAYCASLACTGIEAASVNCDTVLPELVKKTVPASMQDDYPTRLLACVNKVCGDDPYGWTVDQVEPTVGDDTTFSILYENWFKAVVS